MSDKNYSRRKFLKTVGSATAALPFLSAPTSFEKKVERDEEMDQHNVIFILSDDHRWDFMSHMNTPNFLETPNMDRMIEGGVHLENAYVTTSLCSPSRASILTGLYTHNHGVADNQTLVPEELTFFPEMLREAGYETAFVGKWHMGHSSAEPRRGFDHWVSFRGQGTYFNPTLNVNGEQVRRKGYITDILTDYALEWLNRDHDKPFFLFLSHKAVHAGFRPAPRHKGKYSDVRLDLPPTYADTEENYRGKPEWVKRQRNSFHGVDYTFHGNQSFEEVYRGYCESLLALDEGIGEVLDWVDASDDADQTLTMYMGDNGFCLGEHGLIDKRHMYEPSIRVPLIAYGPGIIEKGVKVDEMVQNIDLTPTILEAAGLKAPEEMDGRSFFPLLQGDSTGDWRKEIFYEYFWEYAFPHTPTVFGVKTQKYKYMYYHGIWDINELYDMENDPHEQFNLIDHPEMTKLKRDLRERVFDWLERTGGMQIPLRPPGNWRADRYLLD